ncbi:MAG: T9SS type A sorting domain-containing protein [Bacteroidales bacterium]|nr:T9SS type A sorting domain-containing protein [Candidatus Colimorpha onthohippi]
MKRFLSFLSLSLLFVAAISAQSFSGGSGTSANPFVINDFEDLKALQAAVNSGTSYEGVHFIQKNHITLQSSYSILYDTRQGKWVGVGAPASWTSIGTKEHPFKGTFTVAGQFEIKGLKDAPLFGYVEGARISGIQIYSSTINIEDSAAAICRNAMNTTFDSCAVRCNIVSLSGAAAALAVHAVGCTFDACANLGEISGATSVAGLVVVAENATMTNCYNAGTLMAGSGYTGGLVAEFLGAGSSLTTALNAGLLKGDKCGALVGYAAEGSVKNAFFATQMSSVGVPFYQKDVAVSVDNVAVGDTLNGNMLSYAQRGVLATTTWTNSMTYVSPDNCLPTLSAIRNVNIRVAHSVTLLMSENDKLSSVNNDMVYALPPTDFSLTSRHGTMQIEANGKIKVLTRGMDTIDVWYQGTNWCRAIPIFVDSVLSIESLDEFKNLRTAIYDNTKSIKYDKSVPTQLVYISEGGKGWHFRMTTDIDVNPSASIREDGSYTGTPSVWQPLGSEDHRFRGTFDGEGHTLSGIYDNSSANNYRGFVGYAEGATICNLAISKSYFDCGSYVGAICGQAAAGTIVYNCFNNSPVKADSLAGGIVGYLTDSRVDSCVNAADVYAKKVAGGIVGDAANANVYVSMNAGDVSSNTRAGGIIATAKGNTEVSHCLAVGQVHGMELNGGIAAGVMDEATVVSCLYDNQMAAATKVIALNSSSEASEGNVSAATDTVLDADFGTWSHPEKRYPMNKVIEQYSASNVVRVPFYLAAGENTDSVVHNFTLESGAEWTASNDVITINGSNVVINTRNASTVLTATVDGVSFSRQLKTKTCADGLVLDIPVSGDTSRVYDGTPFAPVIAHHTRVYDDSASVKIEYSKDQLAWGTDVNLTKVTDVDSPVRIYVRASHPAYDTVYGEYTTHVTPSNLLAFQDFHVNSSHDTIRYEFDNTPHEALILTATGGTPVRCGTTVAETVKVEYSLNGVTGWTTDVPSLTTCDTIKYYVRASHVNFDTIDTTCVLCVYPFQAPIVVTYTVVDSTLVYDAVEHTYDFRGDSTVTGIADETLKDYFIANGFSYVGSTMVSRTKVGETALNYNPALFRNYLSNDFANVTFTADTVGKRFAVTKRNVTITALPKTKVYDESSLVSSGLVDCTVTGLAATDYLSAVEYDGSATAVAETGATTTPKNAVIKNAAEEVVTDCYNINYVSSTLAITPAEMHFTHLPYGNIVNFGYDATQHFIPVENLITNRSDVTLEYSEDGVGGWVNSLGYTNANTSGYPIYVRAVKENYDTAKVKIDMVITKASLNVLVADTFRIYKHENPVFAYNITGFKGLDNVASSVTGEPSISTTAVVNSQVGQYDIIAEQNTLESDNYNFNFPGNPVLTIIPDTLHIVVPSGVGATHLYDGAKFAPVAVLSPAVEGATIEYSVDSVSWSTIPNSITNAVDDTVFYARATYAPNYVASAASYHLTVLPCHVTVNVKGHCDTLTYDGMQHMLEGYELEIINGSNSYPFSSNLISYVGDVAHKSIYSIDTCDRQMSMQESDFAVLSQNFKVDSYIIEQGSLVINQDTLHVRAADSSKVFDGYALTQSRIIVEGLNGIDRVSESNMLPTSTITAVGSHINEVDSASVVVMRAQTVATHNYYIDTIQGMLTVTPGTLTIHTPLPMNCSKTYDAQQLSPAATVDMVVEAGVSQQPKLEYSVDYGASWSEIQSSITDAGFVNVWVRASRDNYDTANGQYILTIAQRNLTIKAQDTAREYSEPNPTEWKYIYSGFAEGEDEITTGIAALLEASAPTATATAPAGASCPIEIDTVGATNPNYNVVLSNEGRLHITKATNHFMVSLPATLTKYYDGTELKPSASAYCNIDNQVAKVQYATSQVGPWSDNPVAIDSTCSQEVFVKVSHTDNYEDSVLSYTLTIMPQQLTVSAANKSRRYYTANPEITYSVSGFVNSEDVTTAHGYRVDANPISTTAELESEVGNYPITVDVSKFHARDYVFVAIDGVLSVTNSDIVMTLPEPSECVREFNGTPLVKSVSAVGPDGTSNQVEVLYSQDTGKSWMMVPPSITNAGAMKILVKAKHPNCDSVMAAYTLTVLPRTGVVVKIEADSIIDTLYTSSEIALSGFSKSVLVNPDNLYDVNKVNFNGTDNLVCTEVGVYSHTFNAADFENTDPNFTNVQFEIVPGRLKITKRNLTVTGKAAAKDYDATPLVNHDYTIEGLQPHDMVASLNYPASQTEVGSTENIPSDLVLTRIGDGSVVNNNYNISYRGENLEVESFVNVYVEVFGNKQTVTYDGTVQTVHGYRLNTYNDDPEHQVVYDLNDVVYETEDDSDTIASSDAAGNYSMNIDINKFKSSNANLHVTFILLEQGGLTINKRDITVDVLPASKTYDGQELTSSQYTQVGLADADTIGGVQFSGAITNNGSTPNDMTFDIIRNGQSVIDNYNVTVNNSTLTVNKVFDPVVVKVIGNRDTVYFDGSEHVVSGFTLLSTNEIYNAAISQNVLFSGSVADSVAKGTTTGSVAMTLAPSQFINVNYNFANVSFVVEQGDLTINQADMCNVYITGHSDSLEYNGSEQSVSGYDVIIDNPNYAESDFSLINDADSLVVRDFVGTSTMNLSAASFVNNNANFRQVNFVVVPGNLTITKAPLTLTTGSNVKEYDGVALKNTKVTAGQGQLKGSDKVSASATGSITELGSVSNPIKSTYAVKRGSVLVTDNYDITVICGTLQVVPSNESIVVTVEGNSESSFKYNGEVRSVSGYRVTSCSHAYYPLSSISYIGSADDTIASRKYKGTTQMNLSELSFENNDPRFLNVTFDVTPGFVKVSPMNSLKVNVIGNVASYMYDTAEQSVTGFTMIESSASGLFDASKVVYTGDSTAAGVLVGQYSMGLVSDIANGKFLYDDSNFVNVKFVCSQDGLLTIVKRTGVVLTIKGAVDEVVYNSNAQKLTGYTWSSNFAGFLESDFTVVNNGSVRATMVGTYPLVVNNSVVTLNCDDRYENVELRFEEGSLTIKPAELVLRALDAEHEYDALPFTSVAYEVVSGLQAHDSVARIETDGYIINKGSVQNSITHYEVLRRGDGQFMTNNYSVTVLPGTLTVKPNMAPVVIKVAGNRDTVVYDGEAHILSGFTIQNPSAELYRIDTSLQIVRNDSIKRTDAGSYSLGIDASWFNNKNENFGNVQFDISDAMLTILPYKGMVINVRGRSASVGYDAQTHEVHGYELTSNNPFFDASKVVFAGDSTISKINAGTYSMGLKSSDFSYADANFDQVVFNVVDGQLAISRATLAITANSAEKVYDGSPLTDNGYEVNAVVGNDRISSINVLGTQTTVGSSINYLSDAVIMRGSEIVTANYDISYVPGMLTVSQRDVTVLVKGNTEEVMYDGQSHIVMGYTLETSDAVYNVSDVTCSSNAIAFGQDANTYNMGLQAAQFNNTNPNFNVSFVVEDGSLVITPNTSVTVYVTGSKNVFVYDASQKSVSGYTMRTNSPIYNINSNVEFNGIAEVAKVNAGVYPMRLSAADFVNTNANFSNVNFEVVDGLLTINRYEPQIVVNIIGENDTVLYDGTRHTINAYTAVSNADFYDATLSVVGNAHTVLSSVNAGTYTSRFTASDFSNINDNFANVRFNVISNGSLVVNKRSVMVTSVSDTVFFDGNELTRPDVIITGDGFVEGDVLSVSATGAITNPGQVVNSIELVFAEGKESNYEVALVEGTLNVLQRLAVYETGKSDVSCYGLADGSYNFTVDGAVGSVDMSLFEIQTVSMPIFDPITQSENITIVKNLVYLCSDHRQFTVVTDGVLANDLTNVPVFTAEGIANLVAGDYCLMVADSLGSCVRIEFSISQPELQVSDTTVFACDQFVWNGNTYTSSVEDSVVLQDIHGCDSTARIHLTLGVTHEDEMPITACDAYTLVHEGVTYRFEESIDTVIGTMASEFACANTVHLDLQVNYSTSDEIHVSTPSAYTWNGQQYDQTGVYTKVIRNAAGCDSTIILHLTMVTGIEDINDINVNVYPNPSYGMVNIDAAQVDKVEVLDLYGRTMATYEGQNSIDLTRCATGTYTLRITLPEGVVIRKVVKR